MEFNHYNIFKFFHCFYNNVDGWFFIYQDYLFITQKIGSKEYKTFITMERKLMKYIMNPSLIFPGFGVILTINLEVQNELWLNLKFCCFFSFCFSYVLRRIRKVFERVKTKNLINIIGG